NGVSITYATVVDGATTYSGFRLEVATASLIGISGVELYASAIDIKTNTATGGVAPTPLNWTALGIGLDLSGAITLSVGGTLGVNIANGFVAAAGTFRLERSTVSGGGLTSESALKLSITGASLWAGVGGGLNAAHTAVVPGTAGISASGVNLTLGAITTSGGATYTGLRLTVAEASLVGIPGVDAYVSSLRVEINKAVGASPLNWSLLTIDGGGGSFGLTLSGAIELNVEGTLAIQIGGGFVAAAGTFGLTRAVVSGGGLTSRPALKLTVSNASLWAGVGGGLNAAHTAVVPGTIGISANGVNLIFAAVSTVTPANSYTGLKLTVATASLIGIPGIELYVSSLDIRVNTATTGTPLNWSALTIDGGGGSFGFDLAGATQLSVGGTLAISIGGGFVAAVGTFRLERLIVSGGGLTSETALKLTIESASLWAGVGGGLNAAHTAVVPGTTGISALGVNVTLGAITTATNSYTGLKLSVEEASLLGITGVDLFVTGLTVTVNTATTGTPLNWTTLTIDGGGSFGLDLSGAITLSVSGTLGVSIADGFVAASGTFSLVQQTVSGTGGAVTLTSAQAISLSITGASLWVGLGGSLGADHVTVNNGTVGFGITNASVTLGSVKTAANSYTGLQIGFTSATIVGIDDSSLFEVRNGFVRVNKVATGTTKLDWKNFSPGGPLFGLNLDAATDLSVGGEIAVRIENFVWASASFAITKQTLLVIPVGATTAVSVQALEIGLDNGNLFAGVGNPDEDGDGVFESTDDPEANGALGIAFQSLSLGLLSATATDGTKYFALRARGTGALVGIDGFDIGGSLEVQINKGTTSGGLAAPGIDFSLLPAGKLSIPSGPTTTVDIDLDDTVPLRVVGTAHLSIGGFVFVTAGFAIQQGVAQDVTLDNGNVRNVNVLTIGISDGYAFIGANGPYWITDADGNVTEPADPGAALGIALSAVELGIALLKPTTLANKTESYYALTGSGTIEVIGLDALTLDVRNLEIQVNGSNVPGRVVNFVHANSFGPDGLEIPTGPGESVEIKFATELLRASADITLSISQFVYVSGSFAFEKGAPLTLMPRTGGQAAIDLSVIKIGATGVHAFVGLGGPYWVTDPDGTVHAPAGSTSAIGLALGDVEFGLALMKPVGPSSTLSYYALTATVGEISLVSPFPGFVLTADELHINVNGSNAPDGHVVNLSSSTITVPT
ncbi:MAG: hypothetical protein ABI717_07905, partial [Actinomycetota bacterium]